MTKNGLQFVLDNLMCDLNDFQLITDNYEYSHP